MKRRIAIVGTRGKTRAIIWFDTEAEWVPMEKHDVGRTKDFIPDHIERVEIGDELGSRSIVTETIDTHGMDIKRRKGTP